MVRLETREIVTCDFCGKEFSPSEDYPRGRKGELGEFGVSMTFRIKDHGSGIIRSFDEGPGLGFATGDMCASCFEEIGKRIMFNQKVKGKGEKDGKGIVAVPGKVPGNEEGAAEVFSHT